MKMIPTKVIEVEGEGLLALLEQNITVFCGIYIYTGKLVGVNETCIKLEKASIVYETGAFTDSKFKDAQSLPNDWYIQLSAIESFGVIR